MKGLKQTYVRVCIAIVSVTLINSLSAFAAPKVKPVDPATILEKAKTALAEYRFEEAEELIDDYYRALKKATPDPEAEVIEKTASLGNRMLESVEKLKIIDSITVDRDRFLQYLPLSDAAGSLNIGGNFPVFRTQDNRLMLTTVADETTGNLRISMARILADGQIETPAMIVPVSEGLTDMAYPFLMPDGLTLYFAGRGENSLGSGYDIYITRRSGLDQPFMQPQNLGMPYNSPANDYLLVIDETIGRGWWITDRNVPQDKVTIYTFIPSAVRENYPPDTPGIEEFASLSNGFQRVEIQETKTPTIIGTVPTPEFEISLPGHRIVHYFSELKSSRARDLAGDYIDALRELNADKTRLQSLRTDYCNGNQSVANEIIKLEQKIERENNTITNIINEISRAEQ